MCQILSIQNFFLGVFLCAGSPRCYEDGFNNRCISYSIFHHLIMILSNSNQDHGVSPPLEIFSLLPFSNSHHSHNHQYSMNKYVLNEFTTYLMCTTLMETYSTQGRKIPFLTHLSPWRKFKHSHSMQYCVPAVHPNRFTAWKVKCTTHIYSFLEEKISY